MRVLVTGHKGYIGTAMVPMLALLLTFDPVAGNAAGGGASPQGAAVREMARQNLQRSGNSSTSSRSACFGSVPGNSRRHCS